MSQKSKKASKDKRRKEKNQRKAAKKSLYDSYKLAGNNSKRAKIRSKKKKRSVAIRKHVTYCGNVACHSCFPEFHAQIDARRLRERERNNAKARAG